MFRSLRSRGAAVVRQRGHASARPIGRVPVAVAEWTEGEEFRRSWLSHGAITTNLAAYPAPPMRPRLHPSSGLTTCKQKEDFEHQTRRRKMRGAANRLTMARGGQMESALLEQSIHDG